MMHNPALERVPTLFTLIVAAFAGVALWLFLPALLSSDSASFDGDAALPPSLMVDGEVDVTSENGIVRRLAVPLAVRGETGIVLTENGRMRVETFMSESAAAAVPATYALEWPSGNGDNVLEPGEQALLTVDLPARTTVHPENPLRLVLRPVDGPALIIEDVLPQ